MATSTSVATTRPLPSAVLHSVWQTTPWRAPASWVRTCCCWCGGEDVDDPVDGLGGVLRVQGGEDQVAGLGGGQRHGDRLEVTHLADQDDVRVLAQHVLERVGERVRVLADLALVDQALLVPVQELDRVLDGHDVVARVRLARSMRAASVVDLPEPVGPVTSTMPRGRLAKFLTAGGMPSASSALIS